MVLNRLEEAVEGKIELSPTQVQSAKILLDKSLSNAATDIALSGGLDISWPLPKTTLDK